LAKALSTMLALGTDAPHFSLPEPATGRVLGLSDFADAPALVVMVLSNHCPFVKHVAGELARFEREYSARGLAIVGINANDVEKYPDDSPEKMIEEVGLRGYGFPYLFDDFFLFDGDRRLVYRGQLDPSRPSLAVPVSGSDLRAACDALLAGQTPAPQQVPSVGCNIKWKAGNEPDWLLS
jgi:thiol-disulfide isomerase/thioredoxin